MNIIGIDNASHKGVVGYWHDGILQKEWRFASKRGCDSAFFVAVQSALQQCPNPDYLVLGLGPGAYSGVRVALATAFGIEFATGTELLGASGITALNTDAKEYYVTGDIRRSSFFWAKVDLDEIAGEIEIISKDALAAALANVKLPVFTLDEKAVFPKIIPTDVSVEKLILRALVLHQTNKTPRIEPVYLRPPHITVSKKLPVTRLTFS